MKILMIISDLGKGGRERRMLELIKGLVNPPNNVQVYLILMSDIVEYREVYDLPIKFAIVQKRSNKDFLYVLRLRKIIREFRPDIIHSWDITASIYVTLAKIFLKTSLINGFIANAPSGMGFSDKRFLRVKLLMPFCKAVVANSQAGLSAYKIPEKKAVCIYNGVAFQRFEQLKPINSVELEILKFPRGDFFIAAMVATFDKRKDYPTLIEAAVTMCRENQKRIFLLVGDGPDLQSNKEKVPSDLLDKQVFFLGKRSDIESILQLCDVGLLITFTEGISNAIIEYMALGKPVIATRGGGTSEIVQDGKNGILIDPQSPGQLIRSLELLEGDSRLRNEMGNYAYTWVRDKFQVSAVTDTYLRLYRRFIRKRRKEITGTTG